MYPSDGVHASPTWIMSNLSWLQKHWLLRKRRQLNWLLPLPQSNPTMTRTPNLPLHLTGLNVPRRLSLLLWICHSYLLPHIRQVSKTLTVRSSSKRLYTLDLQHDQPHRQAKGTSTAPLECMSTEAIVSTLHHLDMSPPAIRPCDTPNALDTKYHFTAEELHRLTGCRRFRNYRHLIHTSKDGQFLDNGEFPVSIGAYTTNPKAPHGKLIDRTPSRYLDIVHIDIAFGDCMSVGGYKYALIFVDRATRFNWCFGVKSLHCDDIISAFLAFCAEAGNLAPQF